MQILRELDPDASALRKARKLQRRSYVSPGPNATWHVDGYDKLKAYGLRLPMHGCVDRFSRRIMWLKVCKSNNDPVIPASFFLHAAEENRVRPILVQTDCGTENGILAASQCLLAGEVTVHCSRGIVLHLPMPIRELKTGGVIVKGGSLRGL